MSWVDFVWNVSQSGQIDTLDERLKVIEKDFEFAKQWINYLHERHLENVETIARLENIIRSNYEQSGRTHETCRETRPEGNQTKENGEVG